MKCQHVVMVSSCVHSRFEYNASASLVKEVSFEEAEGLS